MSGKSAPCHVFQKYAFCMSNVSCHWWTSRLVCFPLHLMRIWGLRGWTRENQIVTEDNLDSLQQRCAPSPAIRGWPDEHWPWQRLWPIWPWAANWRFCSVMAFALIVVVLFVDSCLKKSAYFTWCKLGLPTKKADVQKYRTVAQFGDDEKCPGFSGWICGSSSENFANTMTVSLSGWICGSSSESFAHTMTVSLSYWTRRYMLRLRFKTLIEGILKKMWAIAETKPAELRWNKALKESDEKEQLHRTYCHISPNLFFNSVLLSSLEQPF